MNIFEIKRLDTVSFSFNSPSLDREWSIVVENAEKQKGITDFCIDLCIKAKSRHIENHSEQFSAGEVGLLLKYFRVQDFIVDRRDTNLENALKVVVGFSESPDKQNILESIDYLSYNQQLELAEVFNKTLD